MHVGRAGWTWYTGAAGWMYQAAIERLLGLRRQGATFSVAPSIPAMWPGFSIRWKIDGSEYVISVVNPEHQCSGVESATLDGTFVDASAIPFSADRSVHHVDITMGRNVSASSQEARSLRETR